MKLALIQGVPASGKSTILNAYLDALPATAERVRLKPPPYSTLRRLRYYERVLSTHPGPDVTFHCEDAEPVLVDFLRAADHDGFAVVTIETKGSAQ